MSSYERYEQIFTHPYDITFQIERKNESGSRKYHQSSTKKKTRPSWKCTISHGDTTIIDFTGTSDRVISSPHQSGWSKLMGKMRLALKSAFDDWLNEYLVEHERFPAIEDEDVMSSGEMNWLLKYLMSLSPENQEFSTQILKKSENAADIEQLQPELSSTEAEKCHLVIAKLRRAKQLTLQDRQWIIACLEQLMEVPIDRSIHR